MVFLGSHDGQYRVYDGAGKLVSLTPSYLAAIWDGVGIVISDQPAVLWPLYAAGLVAFSTCLVLVAAVRISLPTRTWGPAGLNWILHAAREVMVLLAASMAVVGGMSVLSPGGYLSNSEVLSGIRERHIGDLKPHLGFEDLQDRLRGSPPPLVIDARLPRDFELGHIPGAISFPADAQATPQKARQILAAYPRSTPVVLYCQSPGCGYDDHIARLLDAEGYTDLSFYSGGWLEWQERTGKSADRLDPG